MPTNSAVVTFCVLFTLAVIALCAILALLHRKRSKADAVSPGLYGVVGKMGSGKSYFMVNRALEAIDQGRQVFANFTIEGAQLVTTWEEVWSIPDGSMLLIDEAHLWWSSQTWKVPPRTYEFFSQLRHHDITCFWASQRFSHVGRRIRDLTFGYWEAKRYRKGHQYTLFEADGFESPTKRVRLARFHLVRSPRVQAAYDTKEDVRAVEMFSEPRRLRAVR